MAHSSNKYGGDKTRRCYLNMLKSVYTKWLEGPIYPPHDNMYMVKYSSFVNRSVFNTLRPRENGRHFADDIFKCIFLNEYAWNSLRISLKFVPKVQINNIPSLVQIMAWRLSGAKPLSEPILVNLLTHICVTRPQRVKFDWSSNFSRVYI